MERSASRRWPCSLKHYSISRTAPTKSLYGQDLYLDAAIPVLWLINESFGKEQ